MDEPTINLKYPKLENPTRQFRMMALEPSEVYSSDIKCHIHHRSRYRNPEYEALSYRWGDTKDTTPIYVRLTVYEGEEDGHGTSYLPFPVTRNLEQALRALRLPDRVRLLWVDALCINQKDDVERGQQVRMMDKIYQNCTRDLLWLGPENAQISRAMKLIPRIQGHDESGHDRTCKSMVETESITFSDFSEQDWNDFKSLVLHPDVWGRVWIIQELILSPKFTLVCGKDTLDWNCIGSVLDDNHDISRMPEEPHIIPGLLQESIRKVITIWTYRFQVQKHPSLWIRTLLSTFFNFIDWEATDERDKVYAVLSLTIDGRDLDVDYSKTMDQLSIAFAKMCLAQNNVRLLSHSTSYRVNRTRYIERHPISPGNSTNETEFLVPRRKDWPTWIPDLSDDIVRDAKVSGLSIAGETNFNACGSLEFMEAMQISQCKITPSLELLMAGVFVDSVALVNPITLVSENETPRDRWIRDVLAWAPPETKQPNAVSESYPWSESKNESLLSAYWRTIVTDRHMDRRLSIEDLRHAKWYMEISESSEIPEEQILLPGWRFGKTTAGMYCMLPPQTKVGDTLCVPMGGLVPLLLRPRSENDELYDLIGEAYVHGNMDGMAILRSVSNMSKLMQADQNHDFEHMERRLQEETAGTQFYMKIFTIA